MEGSGLVLKFESRDEWLVTCDLWLGDWKTERLRDWETSDIRYQTLISSFRAKQEIFVMRGLAVNDWKFQTGNLLSTYPRASPRFVILSGEKRRKWDNECQNSCDLSRRISAKPPPSLLTPNSSLLTGEQSFHPQSRNSTPPGLTLNPEPWTPNPKLFSKTLLTQ